MGLVSSSKVISDSGTLKSIFNIYSSLSDETDSMWKGISSTSFNSTSTDFINEYSSTIMEQFELFAQACSLYEEYVSSKNNADKNKKYYTAALKTGDDGDIKQAKYYKELSEKYRLAAKEYKTQIIECLDKAKSKVLNAEDKSYDVKTNLSTANLNLTITSGSNSTSTDASKSGVTGTSTSTGMVGTIPQNALSWAIATADDNSHGYSQANRYGNPDYDCSSFVITAMKESGADTGGATYTGDMRECFLSTGKYEWIPGDPDVNTLQPGDILLNEVNHTEMYAGNGKNVGAHNDYDYTGGDLSGKEIRVDDYYSYPWDGVLRYKG